MKENLTQKTALITGSARRIGKAFSWHLAAQGWNLALHYNNSVDEAISLKQDLSRKYPHSRFDIFQGDLGNENYAANLLNEVVNVFGSLELLINNASVFIPGTVRETNRELFQRLMDVNFRAPFLLLNEYARVCKKGRVVNMLDTRISRNQNSHAVYSLSKKVLGELTLMAALELAPDFTVNGIAPGATLPPYGQEESYLDQLISHIPMKASGGVQALLSALDFLLLNRCCTGQIIFCDGGEHLM